MNGPNTPADVAQALLDPSSVFETPEEVVARQGLSDARKIEILRRWEYDARELEVAEEESMIDGDGGDLLDRIHQALHALGAQIDLEHTPPTKQGGVSPSAVKGD